MQNYDIVHDMYFVALQCVAFLYMALQYIGMHFIVPNSSIMMRELGEESSSTIRMSSISRAKADFPSDGTSWLLVRKKKWSYLGTCALLHGTNSPQLASSAATKIERIRVDFPLMLGAVKRNIPCSSKSLSAAVDRSIQ